MPDQPTKQSKADCQYRMGNQQRSCGLCGYFQSKEHKCDVTDEAGEPIPGDISPFGFCNSYQRQDNPFVPGTQATFDGDTEGPAEDAAPGDAAEDAPAPMPAGPPPGVMIGRKTYLQ